MDWNKDDMTKRKIERVLKRGKPRVRSTKCIAGRLLSDWKKGEVRRLSEMQKKDIKYRDLIVYSFNRSYGTDAISKVMDQLRYYGYIERVGLGLYQRTAKRLK